MNRNLSVFLDVLRLFAALLVLIGHMAVVYRMDLPDIVAHSAKEGVAIFFVLSGFVIAFVTAGKERDWQAFARARGLRMYSVVPLAIAVLVVCYAIGRSVNPAFYGLEGHGGGGLGGALVGDGVGWLPILRYLTFTNELWFDRVLIPTGAPFWSLGFEAAYYVAFAILIYARRGWRWPLVALWLLACGPRIAAAFPLWLVGVAAWHVIRLRPRLDPLPGIAALAALALATLIWRKWGGAMAIPLFEWPAPSLLAASMAYYLVLALLVASTIIVFAACAPERSIWPPQVERAVRYCAGASFTLYIAHLPVMVLIAAVWPASTGTLAGGFVATAITLAAMLALAELGERRKAAYARFFARLPMIFDYAKRKRTNAID